MEVLTKIIFLTKFLLFFAPILLFLRQEDRAELFNLVKSLVYTTTSESFNEAIEDLNSNTTYLEYPNFKKHLDEHVLPRKSEWSMKTRVEDKLPTHNCNTTNFVEYSFRNTKEDKFKRCKAFNVVELLRTCLDDSTFYSNRALDVAHGRNIWLFYNQKSRYVGGTGNLDKSKIFRISDDVFKVKSESTENKYYTVNLLIGSCECQVGRNYGPCKHKSVVSKNFNLYNFEVVPENNPAMQQKYFHVATGQWQPESYFESPVTKNGGRGEGEELPARGLELQEGDARRKTAKSALR